MDNHALFPSLLMSGFSHKSAPVDIRERLALSPERLSIVWKDLLTDETAAIKEVVILSTCNRTEYYLSTENPAQSQAYLHDYLIESSSLPADQLGHSLYTFQGKAVAEHLIRVACGLDSLVIGENEILGQVRSAADQAHSPMTNGLLLSTLFRYAIHAGKRARAETEIGSNNISVASIVVELAEKIFGPLENRTALLIGAGKISSITARGLTRAGLNCVMVANRTFERAEKLAVALHGQAVHFDRLDEVLLQSDIVICSTGAPHIILHAPSVQKAQLARNFRPLLIADLAVPRDADPKITSIPGVKLANIDDLEVIVKTSHPLMASVCQEVEGIIADELDNFQQWYFERRCVPVIRALRDKAEQICEDEVEQTLRRLGPLTPHQERLVQAMGKAIVGKLLHEPTAYLHERSCDEDISAYIELVQDLYGIQ